MRTVIVCEKPNVAKRVASVIHEVDVKVVSARGHLIEVSFNKTGEKDGKWTYPVIRPWNELNLNPIEGSMDILVNIKNACEHADRLVSATDLDREGSSIFLEMFMFMKKMFGDRFDPELKRMELSSLSDKEIRKAWSDLKPFDWGRSYAGFSRNIQDMEWGINLTRALTLSTNNYFGLLSGGRVQTPMLKMVVDRDREIEAFKPDTYHQLYVRLEVMVDGRQEKIELKYDGKINTPEKLAEIRRAVKAGDRTVLTVIDRESATPPPVPFSGTTLQIEGNRATGISAKDIADRSNGIAQRLYERGAVSYPGTDSEKYPADWVKNDHVDFRLLLEDILGIGNDVLSGVEPIVGIKEDPAHPCIRPVGKPVWQAGEKKLEEQKKLFDLIVRRCAAGHCDPSIDSVKTVTAKFGNHRFKGVGRVTKQKGWKEVYPWFKDTAKNMANVTDGDRGLVLGVRQETKETNPPARFNIISLIGVCDKHGFGTKNTRPGIIEKLDDRNYVGITRSGKKNVLESTEEGRRVIDVLDRYADVVTSTELTDMFNSMMNRVETHTEDSETFDVFENVNADMLEKLALVMDTFKKNEQTIGVEVCGGDIKHPIECPKCGEDMRLRRGKSGKRFFGCTAWPDCDQSIFFDEEETIRFGYRCRCGMPLISGEITLRSGATMSYVRCLNEKCEQNPLRCTACNKPVYVGRSRKDGTPYVRCVACNMFNQFRVDMDGVEKSDGQPPRPEGRGLLNSGPQVD